MPKYSVILPIYNCAAYLESAIHSVLDQPYSDYELIISNNRSTDETELILEKYKYNSKVKVVTTSNLLTLPEHFDWAQKHALGEWQIYLGGDDALMPYFFELADKLTAIAKQENLRTITSKRAYFFWKNCASYHNNTAVSYYADKKVSLESCDKQMYRCIYGKRECGFFDLPQMYTTSLFHISLLDEIRSKQNGILLPIRILGQDFQLAALALGVENRFLQSTIPLGLVGTSSKGLPYFDISIQDRDIAYTHKIFSHDLIFWYVLISLIHVWKPFVAGKLKSKKVMYRLFSYSLLNLKKENNFNSIRTLFEYVEYKGLSVYKVKFLVFFIRGYESLSRFLKNDIKKTIFFPWRCIKYILKRIPFTKKYFIKSNCSLYISWTDVPDMTMEKALEMIRELVNKNLNFEDLGV